RCTPTARAASPRSSWPRPSPRRSPISSRSCKAASRCAARAASSRWRPRADGSRSSPRRLSPSASAARVPAPRRRISRRSGSVASIPRRKPRGSRVPESRTAARTTPSKCRPPRPSGLSWSLPQDRRDGARVSRRNFYHLALRLQASGEIVSMPYILAGVGIAFQLAMLVHAIRMRREQMWIYLLVLLPGAGSVAYFVAEFLPWAMSSPDARRAASSLQKALDPERDLRRYAAEARHSDSVDSKLKLAAELASNKRFDEAIAAYRGCLTGIFAHEPKIMLALASVEFEKGDHAAAAATLEALAQHNPEFRSAEGHLLYARALES